MDKLSFYRHYYEQTGIRDEDVGSEERVPMVLRMVPPKINSCLDLGCGDGTVLTKLDSDLFLVGLDISLNVLKKNKVKKKVQSRSKELPFKSNCYDMVICTEVLEHLQPEEFNLTINEIERIAKKYIMISVPFDEDLYSKQTMCSTCKYIFHVHLHFRNFNFMQLKTLFRTFSIKKYSFSKTLEKRIPPLILNIRRKYGHRWEWDENALCPRCGNTNNQRPGRTPISILTSVFAELIGKNHPKWIAVLYKRK